MRVYHRETQLYAGGVWTNPVPTATVVVRLPAGATVQTVTAVYNAALNRLYFDTTNALFTLDALYQADWTITLAGVAYTTTDYYVHCTPTTADITPPGTAGISVSDIADTSVTVYHTPPADADYDHTTVFAVLVPGDGTAPVAVSGSGSTIEVTGLKAGYSYYLIAVAYDASGNPSIIGADSIVPATTWPAEMPEFPMFIKIFVDGEPVPRRVYAIDPTRVDANSANATNHELRPNVRGRIIRIRLECHAPVANLQTRGLTFLVQTRDKLPGGLKDTYGN